MEQSTVMAILVPVLVLALTVTMASAGDQFGLFGCPDFKDQADDSVDYSNPLTIATLLANVWSNGPYAVIEGAESDEAREFSCITFERAGLLSTSFDVNYYVDGTEQTTTLTWNALTSTFTGTIPQGLLNSANEDDEVSFTIVSNKDGFMVLKTCKPFFFSHYVATYVLADNTITASKLDPSCIGPVFEEEFGIDAWAKGVCS